MSIHEIRQSRSQQHMPFSRTDYQERRFYITETTGEYDAMELLKDFSSDCLQIEGKNLWRRELYTDPLDGHGRWLGRVVYRQQQTEPTRQWEISTATTRIYQGIGTHYKYPDEACDFGGAIEVKGDENKVEGVEGFEAQLRYQEVHRLPEQDSEHPNGGYLTVDSMREFASMIGKTNSTYFREWYPEEVLFMGLTAVPIPNDIYLYNVTFEFAIAVTVNMELPFKNPVNQDDITTNKRGWHYLWYKYDPLPTSAGACGAVLQTPNAAYIEKVYETDDDAGLRLMEAMFPPASCEWATVGHYPSLPLPSCYDETYPEIPECPQPQALAGITGPPPRNLQPPFKPPNPAIARDVANRAAFLEELNRDQ